jgi:CheY-like chemotaxis protein
MAKAFMSYASKDSIFADLARLKLQDAGIDVWIDYGALHAGEEWRNAIDEGIASSDVVVVVITPESCKSPYVTYEWAYAVGSGIKVIPVLLENADFHPRLAVLQYLDFRDQRKGPWDTLCEEIANAGLQSAEAENSEYVRDMTVDQLQDLIGGVISLATATSKSAGHKAQRDDISRATKSVIGAMQHAEQAPSTSTRDAKRHILWVDDRPNNNVHERAAFESMGFAFTLALSTDEALDVLDENQFVAIISDMGRKEGLREGYVLLDAVRKRGDETPFFIYAGSNAPKYKREASERGAQGSTNHPQELFEMVTQYVS